MPQDITYVGLDVHQDTITGAAQLSLYDPGRIAATWGARDPPAAHRRRFRGADGPSKRTSGVWRAVTVAHPLTEAE